MESDAGTPEAHTPSLVQRALAALIQAKHCVAIELEYNLAQKIKVFGHHPKATMIRKETIPALHREAAKLAKRLPATDALRRLSERAKEQEASRREAGGLGALTPEKLLHLAKWQESTRAAEDPPAP